MLDRDAVSFGEWVRRARQQRGLTQDVLAERVGCATATIRKIEAGERRPSFQMAARLADMLAVPPDQAEAFLAAARGSLDPPDAPAASVAAPVRNLPRYLTPLIGRETVLAYLLQLLRDPACRLITIVGPGGIGKTRLAVELASLVSGQPDGVAFVPLSSAQEPATIVSAIAAALEIRLSGSADQFAQVVRELRDQQCLLMLDSIEHLLRDDGLSELLTVLLRETSGVRVLITSRERLRLSGEWVVALDGLTVPVTPQGIALAETDAEVLFLDRARRIRHSLAITPANGAAVATICRSLAGNPLAIELAASWVGTLNPAEIADEIGRSLDFLSLADRDRPREHQSLRAVFDRSWQMLGSAEQRILAGLAVFRGGITRAAAAEVVSATLPQLAALVTKSLLRPLEPGRYELHELVRQFALEQLNSGQYGDPQQIRTRHVLVFLTLAETADRELAGPDQVTQLSRLDTEHENMRAALDFALDPAQPDPALHAAGSRLTCALNHFWFIRGHHREGQRWTQRALAVATAANEAPLLMTSGFFALLRRDEHGARGALERAIALGQQHNDPATEAYAWHYLGLVAGSEDRPAENRAAQMRSAQLAETLGNQFLLTLARVELGSCAMIDRDLAAAETLFQQGVAYFSAISEKNQLAASVRRLGHIALLRHQYAEARAHHQYSLRLNATVGDQRGVAACLFGLACVSLASEAPSVAAELLGAADQLLAATADTLLHADRDDFTPWIAQIRARLAEPALAAAYAEGQRLSVPQILALIDAD